MLECVRRDARPSIRSVRTDATTDAVALPPPPPAWVAGARDAAFRPALQARRTNCMRTAHSRDWRGLNRRGLNGGTTKRCDNANRARVGMHDVPIPSFSAICASPAGNRVRAAWAPSQKKCQRLGPTEPRGRARARVCRPADARSAQRALRESKQGTSRRLWRALAARQLVQVRCTVVAARGPADAGAAAVSRALHRLGGDFGPGCSATVGCVSTLFWAGKRGGNEAAAWPASAVASFECDLRSARPPAARAPRSPGPATLSRLPRAQRRLQPCSWTAGPARAHGA